ncbi:uncharacterized protein LOC142628917 [Castanea sativa]|uniref:uncharacterized protein LOC142628917 n=1 Tax=Castanea sativa TaxID=21020 RepID=UPI003F64D3CD
MSRIDNPSIGFSEEDARRLHHPHDDALVVTIQAGDYNMHRVLVDNGSSTDILYYPAFQQMGIERERLVPTNALLVGFGGTRVFPLGVITLVVTIGDYPQWITRNVAFLVVNCSSTYNAIIGRPTLNSWKVVTSTYHLMIKFPTDYGVGELRGDQVAAREERRATTEPVERLEDVPLDESQLERTTKIGTLADLTVRQELTTFLKENRDVFAWSREDMPGIDPSVMVHRLNVSPSFPSVRQKKRIFAQEKDRVVAKEVRKLQEIGRNVQVYVDDILVKSQREEDHLEDLKETFDTLRSYNMKLNLGKCAFGVTAGNFLGYMVSQRGIGANPDKIRAIMEMAPPKNIKEVQSLNGKVAALNRFVSRAMDMCLPFFRTLKKSFEWTTECQQAFEDLKAYLFSPPLLSPSQPGEELFLYLAVSPAAVSATLVREDNRVQRPVYYASKALHGRLTFALVTAARKLKPYFQAHTIVVLTDKPLQRAMGSPEAAGRMALWSIELSEFDIQYRPRTAIKGQAVADFIAEFANAEGKGAKNPQWSIFMDGSSNKKAGGVGVVLKSPEGDEIECMIRLDFPTTNNEAEYEALIVGLDFAKIVGAVNMVVHCDSQVVTSQVNGEFECNGKKLKKYWEQAKRRVDEL